MGQFNPHENPYANDIIIEEETGFRKVAFFAHVPTASY